MIRLRIVLPSLMFVALTTTTLHAQVRVRPGMWENSMTAFGKTATTRLCIKPAEAAKSNGSPAMVRAATEKAMAGTGCTLKNFKLEGNALTYTMVCEGSTVLQETKFHGGDSVESTMTFTVGGAANVKKVKNRRTGDC